MIIIDEEQEEKRNALAREMAAFEEFQELYGLYVPIYFKEIRKILCGCYEDTYIDRLVYTFEEDDFGVFMTALLMYHTIKQGKLLTHNEEKAAFIQAAIIAGLRYSDIMKAVNLYKSLICRREGYNEIDNNKVFDKLEKEKFNQQHIDTYFTIPSSMNYYMKER